MSDTTGLDPVSARQLGLVWQSHGIGYGGQWVVPQTVRLCDEDVQRIAEAVVRLLEARSTR